MDDLNIGDVLQVRTRKRVYRVEICANGRILISGHPKYCPHPVMVELVGSAWRGSAVKLDFIGRGMYLEFRHPVFGVIRTSRIEEIHG